MSTVKEGKTQAAEKVETVIMQVTPTKATIPLAVSVRFTFADVAEIADMSVPLRRPRKVSPSINDDLLRDELEAWDAASDEAHHSFEDTLGE